MNFDPHTPETVAKRTTTTTGAGGNTTTVQKKEYFTIKNDKVQDKVTATKVTENWQKLQAVGPVVVMPPKGQSQPYRQPYPQQTGATPYGTEALQQSGPLRALTEATGAKGPVKLADWWAWWYDYNEVYYPSGTAVKAENQLGPQGLTNQDLLAKRGDCLAAGTLVATESGPVAIEKIAVGDRVFCCDVEKGCLVLKPVLRTVVRPEGKLQTVRAGDEEFECGGGHVFRVAGSGWVKARDLTRECNCTRSAARWPSRASSRARSKRPTALRWPISTRSMPASRWRSHTTIPSARRPTELCRAWPPIKKQQLPERLRRRLEIPGAISGRSNAPPR